MTKSTCITNIEDNSRWINVQGQLYRTDGPACEYSDGSQGWWITGRQHPTDAPEAGSATRTLVWLLHEKIHRTDGPAIEYADGTRQWYIDGQKYTNSLSIRNAIIS